MRTDVGCTVACWALGGGARAALGLGVLGTLGHCLSWDGGAQVHLALLPGRLQRDWGWGMLGPSESGLRSHARQLVCVLSVE